MSNLEGVPPVRVLIVDDSVIVRKAVNDALRSDPEIEIVGVAENGKIALEKLKELKPEVMVLDIEMPICDGFGVLKKISEDRIRVKTIMFSTLTERGAWQTIKALSLGANDYVPKPTSGASVGYSEGVKKVAKELTPKIKQFRKRKSTTLGVSATAPNPSKPMRTKARPLSRPGIVKIVAIGISTGGPEALTQLLPEFASSFPVPIVIVQHMPKLFTKLLSERLNLTANIKVLEAADGMILEPGVAYIAPGGYHLEVNDCKGKILLSTNQDPPKNSCRPAVDVLFHSVAEVYGSNCLAVIMTGMGKDGLEGIEVMQKKGSQVIAQDQASSVVWGMPGAVVNAGLANEVLPLNQMASAIQGAVMRKAAIST